MDPATLFTIIGATAAALDVSIRAGAKVIEKLREFISKTEDPRLKKLLEQKKELEEKENAILATIRGILANMQKALKSGKNVEEAIETSDLLQQLQGNIGELKIIKTNKLNIQKDIYLKSREIKQVQEHVVDLRTVKKEILSLELTLQEEEMREAKLEAFIAQMIEKLQSMKAKKSQKLAELLEEFKALSNVSVLEAYVDENIYRLLSK